MKDELEELIQTCVDENKVFALWRNPDSSVRGVAANSYQKFLSGNIPSEPGFLLAPFHENKNHPRLFIPAEVTLPEQNHLLHQVQSHPLTFMPVAESTSKKDYASSFKKLKGAIRENKIEKAVLSRILFSEAIDRTKAAAFFFAIEKAYPHAMVYLLNVPGKGCWTGATPEVLLDKHTGGYQTSALAGTMPATSRNKWRKKEEHEQALVSEFIRDILQENHIVEYHMSGLESITAGNVMHLKTSFFIPNNSITGKEIKLAETLHPTPAVCGLPREAALNLILETEAHDRAYYTGFLGEADVSQQKFHFFVNLRCMQILSEGSLLYTGGGITADSDLEEEWQETEEKSKTLLNITKKL